MNEVKEYIKIKKKKKVRKKIFMISTVVLITGFSFFTSIPPGEPGLGDLAPVPTGLVSIGFDAGFTASKTKSVSDIKPLSFKAANLL